MRQLLSYALTILFGILFNLQICAALCTANLIGGNWNNAVTWDCGRVPVCGDDVYIPFGSVVTITANINMSACESPVNTVVGGELVFTANCTISLPAGSCLGFLLLGTLVPSLDLGSTNYVIINGVTEWTGTLLTLPVIGPAGIGCDVLLPVSLTSFDVKNGEKEVVLNWESKSERDNDFYRLEVSANGQYWQELAVIDGSGTTTESKIYSFVDKKPFSGQSYYRLSQTDFNGEARELQSISNVFYGGDYLIYPTQVNELMYVKGPDLENSTVSLVNNLGEEISLKGTAESGLLAYNLAVLPCGNYFVKVRNGNFSAVKRIVVLHK
jgi:hypothetical protein